MAEEQTKAVKEPVYAGSRRIRVFLSSTFQDMQAERDFLVKNTFPAIMRIARQRNVDFSVVDLRWGVTEEEAHEGKVIEICLNQIEETRPFFIGLIGDRYGWCPIEADISSNHRLLNAYPWVEESVASGLSMTEIEMRFGVFMAEKQQFANFYLKDGSGASDQPEAIQSKLRALREMVEQKGEEGVCKVSHFASPKQLGRHVYQSLLALLDELYPESQADPIHVTIAKQEYLVRQMQENYKNRAALRMLDPDTRFPKGQGGNWCWFIRGESGEGKTALVCNWRKDDPHVIRTLLNEELHSFEDAYAHMAAVRATRELKEEEIIWIVDGLEYFDADEDRELRWLKDKRLNGVNLILTARGHEFEMVAQGIAQTQNRPFHASVPPGPEVSEIRAITIDYLHHFAKGLSAEQLDRIARFPLFKNILVLQYFLQELVQFGIYEELDAYIDTYLRANTTVDLIHLVLERLEKDYGQSHVRTYFGMLSLTQIGIPEADMQRFTGLNTIEWAAFSSALSLYTIRAYGMMRLRSEWKEIAAERYCTNEAEVKEWRKKLIDTHTKLLDVGNYSGDWSDKIIMILFRIANLEMILSEKTEFNIRLKQEIILNRVHVEGVQRAFRDVTFMEILMLARNVELALSYKEYINGSARKFLSGTNYLSWYTITLSDLSSIYASIVSTLLPSMEERKKVYRHIRRQLLPRSVKKALLDAMEQYVATNTENTPRIEDTWEQTDIKKIDDAAVAIFYTAKLPYIRSDERIRNIEEKTDRVLERYRDVEDKTDSSIFYLLKSYCLYRKGEYKKAYETFTIAIQYNVKLFSPNTPPMGYFLILLKLKRYNECRDIIEKLESMLLESTNTPTYRDSAQLILIEKLLYCSVTGDHTQVETVKEQILTLYDDEQKSFNFIENVGFVATNHQLYALGAELFIEARKRNHDPEEDHTLLDNIVYNYRHTDDVETTRMYIKELREAEIARNKLDDAVGMEVRYAETYLTERKRYIRRSQIKQCFENYIEAMKPLLLYGPEKVGERNYYVRRVNYYIELAKGELNYHLWGPESAFIQQLADDMESIYEKAKQYGDAEWIYNMCMLAAERVERITNEHFTTSNSYLNRLAILQHRNDANFEKTMEIFENRDLKQHHLNLWDKIEPIHPFEWRASMAQERMQYIYNTVWNDAMEIFRLPFLRRMAEKENDPRAMASLILYAYIMDDDEAMQYYLQMAEPYKIPPLMALRQVLKSLHKK